MNTQFSTFIKNLRIAKGLTLREFCLHNGLDPSNWSKVERGVNPPPGDVGVLERIATFLGLTDGDKLGFMDRAALDRREIPEDVSTNPWLQKALPAFFRAARGHNLSPEELVELEKDLRKLHTRDSDQF